GNTRKTVHRCVSRFGGRQDRHPERSQRPCGSGLHAKQGTAALCNLQSRTFSSYIPSNSRRDDKESDYAVRRAGAREVGAVVSAVREWKSRRAGREEQVIALRTIQKWLTLDSQKFKRHCSPGAQGSCSRLN